MSQLIRIPDYCNDGMEIEQLDLENLRNFIADKSITDIVKENQGLLVFPNSLADTKDGIEKDNEKDKYICKTIEKKEGESKKAFLLTSDVLGFVGCKSDGRDNDEHKNSDTELTIYSRFTPEDKDDFFLHYMVQKVFNINMFDLKHSTSQDRVFDFLLCLFPKYLKEALRQGLYKQYVLNKYNDSNVRGMIDVARHIKMNIPFVGKIAYNVREFSYDNNITQLIRHTIEYIRSSRMSRILRCDKDTISFVSQICEATPSYKSQDRNKVISKNLKAPTSPYYLGYIPLQKLCIQILTHKKLKYGNDDNDKKIYGLLFVGSWLWEEYLSLIMKDCGFTHAENKTGKNPIYLFINNDKYKRFPDYYKHKGDPYNSDFVLDAKYKKRLEGNDEIDRNDMHQVITYMHVLNVLKGGVIYPYAYERRSKDDDLTNSIDKTKVGTLRGMGGDVYKIGVPIPCYSDSISSFEDFQSEMKKVETALKKVLNNIE